MQLKQGTELQNGKYVIICALGQGGFGITYLAEQVALRRKVAIKEFFMRDCCERDEATRHVTVGTNSQKSLVAKFRMKFFKEAQMMASLYHPHIVRVTDVFEENGTAYYVMDNLPGGSLSALIKMKGCLSEEQAEAYIRQVADALALIHSKSTVHLDVKPSNILLDERGEAVLIDFGLSKHYDDSGEQTSSTPIGISKGYAPLEQSRSGDVSQFKPTTDIYALGATLYTLVSGEIPPEASIVNEDGLTRPSGISDRIWYVIQNSMQPKRKDRPQDITEFLSLLDNKNYHKVAKDVLDNEDRTVAIDDDTIAIDDTVHTSTTVPTSSELPVTPRKPKSWLWALVLAIIAIAIVLAFILGRKDSTSDEMADLSVNAQPIDSLYTNSNQTIYGSIEVSSSPEGATIFIDGKDTKTQTPATIHDLEPGRYEICLVMDGYSEYKDSITISAGNPVKLSQALSNLSGFTNGHEWVDLGLSVKWATCNVGASSPSDIGFYFAWGETSPKESYTVENYKYFYKGDYRSYKSWRGEGLGSDNYASKYNGISSFGVVDNLNTLQSADDAAYVNWGNSWRTPTYAEYKELLDNCSSTVTSQGGQDGRTFTSKVNGKSIFMPITGWNEGCLFNEDYDGLYWSSSLSTKGPLHAWYMSFDKIRSPKLWDNTRTRGCVVRPVTQ